MRDRATKANLVDAIFTESNIPLQLPIDPNQITGTDSITITFGTDNLAKICNNRRIALEQQIKIDRETSDIRFDKLEEEIKRFNRLQRLATKGTPKYSINEDDVNTREYAKYVLREGTPLEKRELMGHLRSRLILKDKKITLLEEEKVKTE